MGDRHRRVKQMLENIEDRVWGLGVNQDVGRAMGKSGKE